MTETNFRALCEQLMELVEGKRYDGSAVIAKARVALARPEPVAPTDEEIMEVFWEHQNGMEELWADDWPAAARAVLAKWGNQ